MLLDAFPQEKQGQAMTIFGMAALLAPVVGPTLGGYITDNYGWRWIFYLNVPVGLLAYLMCHALVEDPEYLQVERARNRNRREPFDVLGLCLLTVTMVCWEVMLSKGQEWDWLGDPFYRVQGLLILFMLGLGGLIYRELRLRNPLVALRTMADRNFGTCCVIIFCAYAVLYANTISLPALLQSLFGYDATTSGLVLSPSGIFAIIMLVVVGALLSRGFDARYLMAGGLITMAIGNYWMAHLNLEISPWQVVWPRVVVIAGLSMLFAPLNVAAFIYLPKEIRGAAVGLLALLRNEGGSVGTSVAQIIQERREQFHTLRLNESLDPLNPPVNNLLTRGQAYFPAAQRRCCIVTSDGVGRSWPVASAAGLVTGLLRRILIFGCGRLDVGIFYPAHASFGSGEGGPHWWGVASSRIRTALRISTIVTIAIGLDASCHINAQLGAVIVWLLAGAGPMMSIRKALAWQIAVMLALITSVMMARAFAETPWLMLPFVTPHYTLHASRGDGSSNIYSVHHHGLEVKSKRRDREPAEAHRRAILLDSIVSRFGLGFLARTSGRGKTWRTFAVEIEP